MNNMRMLTEEEENEDAVEVTWEDQQRINTFSKLNTRVRSIEEKLEELKQEKEGLDDLRTELELTDEDESVMYKIGETFVHLGQEGALKRVEEEIGKLSGRVSQVLLSREECEKEMKILKVLLYAKFGRAINLDE